MTNASMSEVLIPYNSKAAEVWFMFVISSGIIAVILNTIILLLLFRFQWLRTTSNIIIGSMVITDILAGLVGIVSCLQSLDILNSASHTACVFYFIVDFSITTASSLHVVAASIERYIAIQYPLHHVTMCSKTRVMMGLAFIWFCSFGFSLIAVLGEYDGSCKVLNIYHPLLAAVLMYFLYHIPIIMFCWLYGRITCTVVKQRKSINNYRVHPQPTNMTSKAISTGTSTGPSTGTTIPASAAVPTTPLPTAPQTTNIRPFVTISCIVGAYIYVGVHTLCLHLYIMLQC